MSIISMKLPWNRGDLATASLLPIDKCKSLCWEWFFFSWSLRRSCLHPGDSPRRSSARYSTTRLPVLRSSSSGSSPCSTYTACPGCTDRTLISICAIIKLTFPKLYEQAVRYISILGTSVPSERIFSQAGNIKNDERSRLTGEHLNMLLFLSSLAFEDWNLG